MIPLYCGAVDHWCVPQGSGGRPAILEAFEGFGSFCKAFYLGMRQRNMDIADALADDADLDADTPVRKRLLLVVPRRIRTTYEASVSDVITGASFEECDFYYR